MLKKILLIALISAIALFAALYLFGSKILNAALKQAIQSGAPLVTQCEVAIDGLELSLFSGEGQVHGLARVIDPRARGKKECFIRFEAFCVTIELAHPWVQRQL